MAERDFKSQTTLAPLPRVETEGRVIVPDFAVFHAKPDNGPHFIESDVQDDTLNEDYQAGFEAGKAEAATVYESTIKIMETTLEQLKSTLASQIKDIEDSHARVIFSSLETVLPALAQQTSCAEMQSVLQSATASEINGKLEAHLHPKNEIAKSFILGRSDDSISIIETADMSETAVHFTWGVSRVEIDPLANAQNCLAILSKVLPMPETTLCLNQSDENMTEEGINA